MIQRRGFTLLELLVTIAIFSAIAAAGVPSVRSMQENAVLNSAAQELASTIRVVQNRALTSQLGADHGVSISANGYTEFHVIPPSVTPVNGATHAFTRATVTSGAGSSITFAKLKGTAGAAQTIVVALGGAQKTIVVTQTGTVTIQ